MLLLIERFYRIANPFTCTLPGLGKVVFITMKKHNDLLSVAVLFILGGRFISRFGTFAED